jgi:integrase
MRCPLRNNLLQEQRSPQALLVVVTQLVRCAARKRRNDGQEVKYHCSEGTPFLLSIDCFSFDNSIINYRYSSAFIPGATPHFVSSKNSVSASDRALIAAMLYTFARVSAVLKLKVDDYYHNGARRRLRLHEKGGKEHEMPVHHLLEQILNEYIKAAGLQSGEPLFQSVNSLGTAVTGGAINRYNAWAAIRKRAKAAGFLTPVGCHTWRATSITIYVENDGRLEHAQQMAWA